MPKATHSSKKDVKKSKKPLHTRIVKKKPYFELITAFLSIPVLLTVILLNVNALKNLNAKPTPAPVPSQNGNSFFAAPIGTSKPSQITTSGTQTSCIKKLGPITISSPGENDVVTENPVTVDISYDDSTYCGAAWSYRINDGSWSGYDDRSVAFYNLPQGPVKFELRVKSIVTAEEKMVTRNFVYNGNNAAPIPTNSSSSNSAH